MPISRSFRAHPSSLYQVRQFIREQANVVPLPPDVQDDLLLAASEACVNAVLHSGSRTLRVTWARSGSCAEIVIQDQGVFQRRVPLPELDEPPGRGILLMMAVMDQVTIQEGTSRQPGTVVRLTKCAPA